MTNMSFGARSGEHIEELLDDVDGSAAVHTVRIGWGNEWREIHLSDANLATLGRELERFWDAARPVALRRTRRVSRAHRHRSGSEP